MIDIEHLLPLVEKPSRYIDHEINAVRKSFSDNPVRILFAFPDLYELGISHLGLKILYSIVNALPYAMADRMYLPWLDLLELMEERHIPLFGLESRQAARDFDLLGITLQSELTFTNVLQTLHSSMIPVFSRDRSEQDPIVMVGGPCATNPLPLAPFIDVFFLGEAEDAIVEIAEVLKRYPTRAERLEQLKQIEGCWVPEFTGFDTSRVDTERSSVIESSYAAYADETSAILSAGIDKAICPHESLFAPLIKPYGIIRSRKYADFNSPEKLHKPQLLSWQLATHNRYVAEIMRGCSRGCRFCHAGYFYRPVRERNCDDILKELLQEVQASGWDEAGLISLSSSDYSCIRELMFKLLEVVNTSKTHVSLPSLRVDSLDDSLVSLMQNLGREGLTIAPEAGSQRLRDVINKNLSEEEILRGVEIALSLSWQKIKLYFMIGLPEETDEDIQGIIDLINKINTLGKRRLNINVTLSPFTPKPFTPFQWCAMLDPETLLTRARKVKDAFLKSRNIRIKYHTIENSMLEACITRGDERMAEVIYTAWRSGARFDAWNENWDYSKWEAAFEQCGIEPSRFLGKKNPEAE
ncbi:MAG TPA: radical SAM protein, partial [Candidatus Cloacimonadota bacterium]|nr:radical SAM protein [Candidatus Cloacimonadota bacterium]